MGGLLHWLAVHTGTVNEAGPYYGFFSGFGSDLTELALVGALIGLLRKHQCAVHRCWRMVIVYRAQRRPFEEGRPRRTVLARSGDQHHHPGEPDRDAG